MTLTPDPRLVFHDFIISAFCSLKSQFSIINHLFSFSGNFDSGTDFSTLVQVSPLLTFNFRIILKFLDLKFIINRSHLHYHFLTLKILSGNLDPTVKFQTIFLSFTTLSPIFQLNTPSDSATEITVLSSTTVTLSHFFTSTSKLSLNFDLCHFVDPKLNRTPT